MRLAKLGKLVLRRGLNSVWGVRGAARGLLMGDCVGAGIIDGFLGGLTLADDARAIEDLVGVIKELRTAVRRRKGSIVRLGVVAGAVVADAAVAGTSSLDGRRVEASSVLSCLTRFAPAAGAGEGLASVAFDGVAFEGELF